MKSAFVIFLLLMTGFMSWGQKKYPLMKFADLQTATSDTIQLKGYILDVYQCPPCPPGAICKPCIENNISVVEDKPKDIAKIPSEKRVRLFTANQRGFEVSKEYLFVVTFRNKKSNAGDNLSLISFKPLR
ncbi:MAG: hypothetical protein JSS79_20995 [Bacteroidetes bacterium]|nr:hypothetical protein [Bacteroidota bacterium]